MRISSTPLRCATFITRPRISHHKCQLDVIRQYGQTAAALQRIQIAKLLRDNKPAADIEVNGWIRSLRLQKRIAFLAIQDGSSLEPLQAVLTPEKCAGLAHGTAVSLGGALVESRSKGQDYEMQVSKIVLLGDNDAEHNPIQPKYQSSEFLRTIPHLRPRVPTNSLLLRLRSSIIAKLTNWFAEEDYVQCHTPIITSSDCEGAGEVFSIRGGDADQDFFRTAKYLTVSSQLHLEALSMAVNKVWTLSPTFRAEKSDTPRHLSEFYMLEAELSFTQNLHDVMDVAEEMLRSVVNEIQPTTLFKELCASKQKSALRDDNELSAEDLQRRWNGLAARNWPRITYAEAVNIIAAAHKSGDASFSIEPSYDSGLAAEHERFIASRVGEGRPVFVTDYPATQKPFYMAPSQDNAQTVACFDLLIPDLGELVGGSIREHRLDELEKVMQHKNVKKDGLQWYLDLRRYGSVPHGGFGLGFDRLICYLAGVPSIRDVVSFPRYHGKCDC